MCVNLTQKFTFPLEIAVPTCAIIIVDLKVPWVDAIEEAYARLADETEEWGWTVKVCPVRVGCRGFAAGSSAKGR